MSHCDQVATETNIMVDQADTSGQMVNSHLLCVDQAFTRIYLFTYLPPLPTPHHQYTIETSNISFTRNKY